MANSARDLAAFGTANLEAVAASGQIWAAGVQDLTNLVASTAKSSYPVFNSRPPNIRNDLGNPLIEPHHPAGFLL